MTSRSSVLLSIFLLLLVACWPTRYAEQQTGPSVDAGSDAPFDRAVADGSSRGGEGGGAGAIGGAGFGGVGGLGGALGGRGGAGGIPVSPPPVLLAQGAHCAADAACAAGLTCTDGVCCSTPTCGTCSSCAAPGATAGVCAPLAKGTQSAFCTGTNVCDGANRCVHNLGQTCASSSECVSGFCADGVCCSTSSCGAQGCQTCGAGGLCHPVDDGTTTAMCGGASACVGGSCLTAAGHICNTNSECGTGHCVDGVCCNTACDDTCFACNQPSSLGTCAALAALPDSRATVACSGAFVCAADGSSRCLLADGQACAADADCASAQCAAVWADNDSDGYGNPGLPRFAAGSTTQLHFCFSPSAVIPLPPQSVFGATDCCDNDPLVHPGSTAWGENRSKCGSYDFNCDSRVDFTHPEPCTYTQVTVPCGGECARDVNTGPTGTGTRHEVLWTQACR